MKEYLRFDEMPNEGKKTKRFYVYNDELIWIGEIYWRTGWRRYITCMHNDIDLDAGCCIEIANFLNKLMEDRKLDAQDKEVEQKMITISADDKCTCGHERGEHSIHYCNGKECGCYYFALAVIDVEVKLK